MRARVGIQDERLKRRFVKPLGRGSLFYAWVNIHEGLGGFIINGYMNNIIMDIIIITDINIILYQYYYGYLF